MAQQFPQIPTRLDLPKKEPTSPEECPSYITQLVLALNKQQGTISNVVSGMEGADIFANRPTAGIRGRIYYATDTNTFYVDDGTTWHAWTLNQFVLGQATVSGAATTGAMTLTPNQPDIAYTVAVTPVSSTGTPAAGSNRVLSVAKAVGSVTVTVEVAPGVGNTVTFDIILSR